jgi:hypothetical protein
MYAFSIGSIGLVILKINGNQLELSEADSDHFSITNILMSQIEFSL